MQYRYAHAHDFYVLVTLSSFLDQVTSSVTELRTPRSLFLLLLSLSLSFVVVVSSFYFNTEHGGASFLALLICLENLLSSNCSSVSIIMMQWCVVLKFAPHTSDAQFNTAINSGAFKSIREYVCTNDPAYLKSSLSSA
jgi:hypothetical protein